MALLTARIPIQFLGQIVTVFYWRTRPAGKPPVFRMPFYPLPAVIALLGWLYVFAATKPYVVVYGLGSIVLGILVFLAWDRLTRDAALSDKGKSLASWPLDE